MKVKTREPSISLYLTIEDLPIWNWEKIKETGDLKYLIKEGEGDVPEGLWQDLQDEYARRCEIDGVQGHFMDKVIELHETIRDLLICSCDDHNPNTAKLKVKRKLLEKEINEIPTTEQTLEDQAIRLEIFFSRDFDTKKMSVLRWHKYIKEYERRIEELQRSQQNHKKA